MKKRRIKALGFLALIAILALIYVCKEKKEDPHAKAKAERKALLKQENVPATAISGVWEFDDWKEMYKFLGLSKEGYPYCMEIDIERKNVNVLFVKDIFGANNVYKLGITQLIPQAKARMWRLAFTYQGKNRWATVYGDDPEIDITLTIFFDDSTPYREGVDMRGSRDGLMSKPGVDSVTCLKYKSEGYKFDKINEGVKHD